MHWAVFVIIGAILNSCVNLGYKVSAAKESLFLFSGLIFLITSLTLFGLAYVGKEQIKISSIFADWVPFVVIAMGIGSAGVMYFFINGMAKGPYSLVDPLWACVYALTSLLIGIVLLREAPSLTSIAGIGLYLGGLF